MALDDAEEFDTTHQRHLNGGRGRGGKHRKAKRNGKKYAIKGWDDHTLKNSNWDPGAVVWFWGRL